MPLKPESMLPGKVQGRDTGLDKVFEAVGRFKSGKTSEAELTEIECKACPGVGSCSGMFTANTMSNLAEALGMALPFYGSAPAVFAERVWLAKQTGYKTVELVNAGIKPRDIMTKEAFYNTIAADMALGGSTNTALHIPAIAHYGDIDITLKDFGKVSKKIPHLTSIAPAGPHHVVDFFYAGGIPAIMMELAESGLINTQTMTVCG